MLCIFDTPSKIAASFVDLAKRQLIYDRDSASLLLRGADLTDNNWSSVAEVGTLQLEFRYLSFITGDAKYRRAVDRAMGVLLAAEKLDGLAPIFIDASSGRAVVRLRERSAR